MNNSTTTFHKGMGLRLIAGVLSLGAFMSSCKKTEIVPYDAVPANRITEFKVTNAREPLYGVVDNVDNTITVYIPYYVSIDFVAPQVKLEEGAKLIGSDGAEIDIREDLEPVAVDRVGYTYTVQDAKKVERTYTLVTKIIPFKEKLSMGFRTKRVGGIIVADEELTWEGLVNSPITLYGNFESSAKIAKLTLINSKTNAVVPNALSLLSVMRTTEIHSMTMQISAAIDSGYYRLAVEHQGRKDTSAVVHLIYKKPFFDFLGKTYAVGETVTLKVRGSDMEGYYSGINTGVKRIYVKFVKQHLGLVPASFTEDLYTKEIPVEIVGQNRTQIQFRFPDLPVGAYSTAMGSGSGINGYSIQYTGFGFYFDFESAAWGDNNLLTAIPYSFELTPKK